MKTLLLFAAVAAFAVAMGPAQAVTVSANCTAQAAAGVNALVAAGTQGTPDTTDLLAIPQAMLGAAQNLVDTISTCVTVG
jgi:hypothetical protein